MSAYYQVSLANIVSELGEDKAKHILSSFSCPLNKDIEKFLKYSAIEFAKQGLASTHLIFTTYKEKKVLVGYYTLTNKYIAVPKASLSKSLQRKISKFARYDSNTKHYPLSIPLIGQLSKNFSNNYNKLITGDELLKMACDKIRNIQLDLSGRLTYLECEDNPKLIGFYEDNGFVTFGKRELDKSEATDLGSKQLIQMIKYLHSSSPL